MSTITALLANAAQLPVADRLELIDAIWATLPDDALPPLSEEWMDEIRKRSAELAAGTAKSVPWGGVCCDSCDARMLDDNSL